MINFKMNSSDALTVLISLMDASDYNRERGYSGIAGGCEKLHGELKSQFNEQSDLLRKAQEVK